MKYRETNSGMIFLQPPSILFSLRTSAFCIQYLSVVSDRKTSSLSTKDTHLNDKSSSGLQYPSISSEPEYPSIYNLCNLGKVTSRQKSLKLYLKYNSSRDEHPRITSKELLLAIVNLFKFNNLCFQENLEGKRTYKLLHPCMPQTIFYGH